MKTHLSIFIFLVSLTVNAQTESQLKKSISANLKKLKDHHAVYEAWFKFQSGDDTSYTKMNVMVYNLIGNPAFTKSIQINNYDTVLAVKNLQNTTTLWLKQKKYYVMTKTDYSASTIIDEIKKDIFKGFRLNKNDISAFKLSLDTSSNYHVLYYDNQWIDRTDTIVTKTVLYVGKQDLLPKIYERWSWFGGGMQYEIQKLISVSALNRKNLNAFVKTNDSLAKSFRTHINGDSLSDLYRSKFKNPKIGDTLLPISGRISMIKDSFNLFSRGDSILILDFSYTSCQWCIYCIPALNKLHDMYENTGVAIYSLDPYENDWPKIDKFKAYYKVKYPIVEIDKDYCFEYGVNLYPTLFILKNGAVIYMHKGYSENMEKEIIDEVNKALLKP